MLTGAQWDRHVHRNTGTIVQPKGHKRNGKDTAAPTSVNAVLSACSLLSVQSRVFIFLKSTLSYNLHIISHIHLKYILFMCCEKCLHVNLTKSRRGLCFDLLQTHFEIRTGHVLYTLAKAFSLNSQACDLALWKLLSGNVPD